MHERPHFFIKIYLSHFIFEWVMLVVCERWAGDGADSYFDPKFFFDHCSNSSTSWVGCSIVGHWGPKALCLPLALNSASCLRLTQAVCVLVILLFNAQLPLFSRLFTQVHLLIDGTVEGQYITLMLSFCAAIKTHKTFLLRFQFLHFIFIISCPISTSSRLKFPYRCFSFYFCFLDWVALLFVNRLTATTDCCNFCKINVYVFVAYFVHFKTFYSSLWDHITHLLFLSTYDMLQSPSFLRPWKYADVYILAFLFLFFPCSILSIFKEKVCGIHIFMVLFIVNSLVLSFIFLR